MAWLLVGHYDLLLLTIEITFLTLSVFIFNNQTASSSKRLKSQSFIKFEINNFNLIEEPLKELYYAEEDTGSYGGVELLYRRAVELRKPHITRNAVYNFLFRQRAYTFHTPARRQFPCNLIFVGSIDKKKQADIVDMVGVQHDNNGNRYILTVIDVFSKFAWFLPVTKQRWEINL